MAQCQGKTKSGDRCQREVGDAQFCHSHQPGHSWDIEGLADDGTISQADFSRVIERSRQRVNQYVEKGVLEVDDDKRLDFAESVTALISRGDIDRGELPFKLYDKGVAPLEDSGADEGGEEEDLSRQLLVAKVNHKVQQARKAKLKADQLEGEMVPLEEVEQTWADIAQQTHDKLMTVPDRLAAQLAGMTDEHAIYETLAAELRGAMIDIADDIDAEHQ